MRISKVVSLFAVTGIVLAAAATSSPSLADSASPTVNVKCDKTGLVTVTGSQGWMVNGASSTHWVWVGNSANPAAKFNTCDGNSHCASATFQGANAAACSGSIKAYMCTSATCAPPTNYPVPAAS